VHHVFGSGFYAQKSPFSLRAREHGAWPRTRVLLRPLASLRSGSMLPAFPGERTSSPHKSQAYYPDQLHVKSEHRRPWRFQMPLAISHAAGQSTTALTSFI